MPSVLITGANRGIGLEFAKQYGEAGWRVYATCRDPNRAVDLMQSAQACAGRISMHQLDVADHRQMENLKAELDNTPIDLLLNNAGVYYDLDTPFGATDYSAWTESFHVNTMAPLKLAELLVDNVAASERKLIVTITSKMGSLMDNTSGGSYQYRSSKAAVNAVMKSLSIDLESRGLIALVLHPGWVLTDMGGPHALIDVKTSVAGMRTVIEGLTLADNGKFLSYKGEAVPW
jgi:NAD(P)-dependent dehydrogenase (short-subunit alcohol dehydrogenase family)